MGSDDDTNAVTLLHKTREVIDAGTGRIADEETRGQMDVGDAVLDHFLSGVFDIPARAAAAAREARHLDLRALVGGKGSFPIPERSKAFSSGAASIAIADDDADASFISHVSLPTTYLNNMSGGDWPDASFRAEAHRRCRTPIRRGAPQENKRPPGAFPGGRFENRA